MSRVYGEPIDVWARGGRPAGFCWRGRFYTVRGVLETWVASREWWAHDGQRERAGPGEPAGYEFWLVEAAPRRATQLAALAIYELRRDTATGDWLLTRVWD